MLAAFLATVLFSISVVCAQRSAKVMGGSEANFWRLTVATFLLGLYAHSLGQGLSGVSYPLFLVSGLIGAGLGDVALFQALPRLGTRLTLLLLQCLSAPFGALIEWTWLGTRLTANQMLCGLVILAGVAIALSPDERTQRSRKDLWLGLAAIVVAAFGNACGAVISRKAYAVAVAAGQEIDGATAAYQRLVGGLLVAGICLLVVKRKAFRLQSGADPGLVRQVAREKWRRAWPWVLANGTAGQTLGVSCYLWALKELPTGVVLPIVALTPLVAIPFTRYIEGEVPTARSLVGGVIAVAGVIALTMVTVR